MCQVEPELPILDHRLQVSIRGRDPTACKSESIMATSNWTRLTEFFGELRDLKLLRVAGSMRQRGMKGAFVLPMVGAANRDLKRFPHPNRFDIARDPDPHVAFGHGIHFCLGAALARLEARIAVSDLLARFESFEYAGNPGPCKWITGYWTAGA